MKPMRLLTPVEATDLDRATFALPSYHSRNFIQLAGASVVQKLRFFSLSEKPTLILVGPGHNGDDGRVVATLLQEAGTRAQIWDLATEKSVDTTLFENFEVVIDALFGVGLSRSIEGLAFEVIEALNLARTHRRNTARRLTIVAVDVPSGLDAQTGWPRGTAVHADHTITMQAAKPGFFQNEGPRLTGHLSIARLPYPQNLFKEFASSHFACGIATAHQLLPRRSLASNKGDHGVVNIVAGSAKYPGAGVLCARSALRTGAGYVRLIQFEDVYPDWFQIPESLFEKWDRIPQTLDPRACWVVGPGLANESQTRTLIQRLLKSNCDKVILDATALNVLSQAKIDLPPEWILTPHPKELARLMQCSVPEVQADRFRAATIAHQKWGATILLKGYKSIVHSGGKSYVILRGHSALAKAGSGDVLAGLLGSLRAQGLEAVQASVAGAVLHAFTADLWLRTGDPASLNPSDIIELLPSAQKEIKAWRARV